VSRYQKGKTNLDFTEARDSEWQWHQLEHMQVCTSLQTDNNANTPPLSFLQAGCPSYRPTNSVKALKAPHFRDSREKTFLSVLLTRWRRKPAGIDMERNYVTVILCIQLNISIQYSQSVTNPMSLIKPSRTIRRSA